MFYFDLALCVCAGESNIHEKLINDKQNPVTIKGNTWTHHVRDNTECETLRRELVNAKQTIYEYREKEQKLKERYVYVQFVPSKCFLGKTYSDVFLALVKFPSFPFFRFPFYKCVILFVCVLSLILKTRTSSAKNAWTWHSVWKHLPRREETECTHQTIRKSVRSSTGGHFRCLGHTYAAS